MNQYLLKKNIELVRNKLDHSTKLIAVTKNQPVETINQAISLGITDIGENRVQEAESKFPQIKGKVTKHMIGHLQTNKVKDAVKIFDMIQSVDSLKLALEINKRCQAINKLMPILIQVNIAGEEQKEGISPEETLNLIQEVSKLPNTKIQGLMGVMPYVSKEEVRPYFRKLKLLSEFIAYQYLKNVEMKYLSMGMSNDYEVAIQEGSSMIRIGTAIFGERKK